MCLVYFNLCETNQVMKKMMQPVTLTKIIDGKIFRVENLDNVTGLDVLSYRIPSGAYSTFRTYFNNRVFPMVAHYERLLESARLQGASIKLPTALITETIKNIIDQGIYDKRLRLTLDLESRIGDIYIGSEPLVTPAVSDYDEGVKALTVVTQRENPKAKLTGFLSKAMEIRESLPAGINEAIMVDNTGRMKEGLSSNFFAVRNNVIYTADEDVLSGITRAIILTEARNAGINVQLSAYKMSNLNECDEAFITSASRSVLPVRMINDHLIGDGKPGAITRLLSKKFWQYIELHTSAL